MIAPSRPFPRRAAAFAARSRCPAALVRSLAAAALAASTTGCLVVSPPVYEHPEQTAPVLTAVSPLPHRPIHVTPEDKSNYRSKDFVATVLSEDSGDPVRIALYVDYGSRTSEDYPYPYRRFAELPSFPAGAIADGQRVITATLNFGLVAFPNDGATPVRECHTVTMVATHALNANKCNCPDNPDDMGLLTWQIIDCDPSEPTCPKSCPPLDCETIPCLFCDDPSLEDRCANR
ncbi:hypothetical protein [Sorangium sp. So ce693]|uniref:hypothetical protein n=1 Tax=Sorangium sp. So ce693 TaxID=3133318 RepID=UPI003F5EDA80